MSRAVLASGLLFAILAMVETATGKLCQMLILIRHRVLFEMMAAIKLNHLANGLLFSFNPCHSSFCGLFEEFMFQPFTHGQVVKTIGSVGHEDSQHKDADSHENVRAEWGILMTIYPRHLHVDERIVGDIDGIAYLAQELVNR